MAERAAARLDARLGVELRAQRRRRPGQERRQAGVAAGDLRLELEVRRRLLRPVDGVVAFGEEAGNRLSGVDGKR